MYKKADIIAEYGITESLLNKYIDQKNVFLINEEEISKEYFQTILPLIENTENRFDKQLKNAEAVYSYNSKKNNISLFKDDAISFLKNLPSNSVDIIAT